MNRYLMMSLVLGLLLLAGGASAAEKVVIYGHLSYIQEGVSVERGDGMKVEKVMLNLPMAAGDLVATAERGRCEIQGDNGTIIRLDFGTRIRFESVLAPSLTSDQLITTIRLLQGNLYIINNIYRREMMQVLTQNAAIKLNHNSKSMVYTSGVEGTFLQVVSGKVQVMYGEDKKSLRTETLLRGEEARVTPGHVLVFQSGPDADFYLWNVGMNRNFDEMHRGISKVPKPIYRYPPALVNWAENWSNIYGKWVYNDYFGYVWSPHNEQWANFSYCPFANFEWVTIGNNTYMVPQEAWGWIPMYLGNWNWDPNHGWIWIPGETFHYNLYRFCDLYPFPYSQFLSPFEYYYYGFWTLSDWYYFPHYTYYSYYYGNPYSYDLHPGGSPSFVISRDWLDHNSPALPPDVQVLMSKINRLSPADREKVMPSHNQPAKPIFYFPESAKAFAAKAATPQMKKVSTASAATRDENRRVGARDWNPDIKWALRTGLEVRLDRRINEFYCPKLGITASEFKSEYSKAQLRSVHSEADYRSHSYGSNFSSSHSSGESSSSSSHSSSSGEHGSSGSSGGSGEKK